MLRKLLFGLILGFGIIVNSSFAGTLTPDSIIGKTKYFLNDTGTTGHRIYSADGNYTGFMTFPNGNEIDLVGTYEITGNVIEHNRTSPSELAVILTYLETDDKGVMSFNVNIDGTETLSYVYDLEDDRDTATVVGKTKYFLNENGATGYRSYDSDGTYTGSLTLPNGTTSTLSGTYVIIGNVITHERTASEETIVVLTYLGETDGVMSFTVSINDGTESLSYVYDTVEERDTALASLNGSGINPALIMYLLN